MQIHRRLAAGAAAAVVAIGVAAVRFVDDAGRTAVQMHEPPPIGAGAGIFGGGSAAAAHVAAQIDSLVASAGERLGAAPEQARRAGRSVGCDVAYVVVVNGRLPTEREWVSIGTGAFAGAAIDAPFGSGAWRELERLKDEVSDAVSDELGYPSADEAQSVGEELACGWA